MLEMTMAGSKPLPVKPNYFFDINFEKAAVGDLTIKDEGTLGVQFTRSVYMPSEYEGVIDHPVHGKCYRFTGYSLFGGDRLLRIWNKKFRMVLKFVSAAKVEQRLLTTGDWPTGASPRPGFTFYHSAVPTEGWSLYCYSGSSVYIYPESVNYDDVIEEYVLEATEVGLFTLTDVRTGASKTMASQLTGETVMIVGGTFASGNFGFIGLLKSITIELL